MEKLTDYKEEKIIDKNWNQKHFKIGKFGRWI
jgi:hypothetical protein